MSKAKKSGGPGGSVQVAVRVRPYTAADGGDCRECVVVDHDEGTVKVKDQDGKRAERAFAYQTVFPTTAQQVDVFEKIGRPMVDTAIDGYNTTLFTYGQTSSGKTYTVQGLPGAGVKEGQEYDIEKHKGLAPRIAEYLFDLIERNMEDDTTLTVTVEMAYLEIYNEMVRDLLVPKGQQGPKELQIRGDNNKVWVEGLSWRKIMNAEQMIKFLLHGNTRRQVASTGMNEVSSRSHSIVQLKLVSKYDPPRHDKPDLESLLNIVDLAGSERQSKTQAEGAAAKEGVAINKSLLMLGRAIKAFGEGSKAKVPLRDSKLTRLLQESLGGSSKTWMIATCSGSPAHQGETLSTLEYAANAMKIVNNVTQNRLARALELNEQKELNKRLEAEIDRLKDELAAAENKVEERAQKMVESGMGASAMQELSDLREELQRLQEEKEEARALETELRMKIAEGVKSDDSIELRREVDKLRAENAELRRQLEEMSAAGVTPSSGTKTSNTLSAGGGKLQRTPSTLADLVDDPKLRPDERLRRMEQRDLIGHSSVFVRKKSFNDVFRSVTGRGAWGAPTGPSIANGASLMDLQAAKQRAIQNEDYREAERLTNEIKGFKDMDGLSMKELIERKDKAIREDNFAEADRIKARIALMTKEQSSGDGMGVNLAVPIRPPPAESTSRQPTMFVGRASISLDFLVKGDNPSRYLTIPLDVEAGIQLDPNVPPQLVINIYQFDASKGSAASPGAGSPRGDQRIDFIVHVIQAKGIPEPYTNTVFCKYVFRWAEGETYTTPEVKHSKNPEFNFRKRFAFPSLTKRLYEWFCGDSVMTFEVMGTAGVTNRRNF